MSSVNKVILIGSLGRAPEVRRMGSGDPVVSFSLATSENWRDKASGERKSKTEWHNVVIFNDALGKIAEQYLKKGSKVFIEGSLQTREYTDKDGNQRKVTEVVLQKFRGELTLLDGRQSDDAQATKSAPAKAEGKRLPTNEAIDDAIPFAPEFR